MYISSRYRKKTTLFLNFELVKALVRTFITSLFIGTLLPMNALAQESNEEFQRISVVPVIGYTEETQYQFGAMAILFFKPSSASGAFFGILSAAAGFVIGAYIPVSQFSSTVQTVCNVFPASQVCALLRTTLLSGIADEMNSSIGGVDNGMFISALKESMTLNAVVFDKAFSVNTMCLYVVAFTLVSLAAMVFCYTKVYKK